MVIPEIFEGELVPISLDLDHLKSLKPTNFVPPLNGYLQTVSQSQTTSIHKSTTDKPIFSKPRIKRGFGKLPIARN